MRAEDRSTERQVAEVILEGGEAGYDLAADAECGNAVRDSLLSVRDDLEDGVAQRLKRVALRLVDSASGTRRSPAADTAPHSSVPA